MSLKLRRPFHDARLAHPEKPDPKSKTESIGHVPNHTRIRNILAAGRALADYRRGIFGTDLVPPGQEPEVDPTMRPGYDLADASRDLQEVRAKAQSKAAKAAADKKRTQGSPEGQKPSQTPSEEAPGGSSE